MNTLKDRAVITPAAISQVVRRLREGHLVILVDDIKTQMGVLLGAADKVNPDNVNVMTKIGKGLVCACITQAKANQLNLPLMVQANQTNQQKRFTISVDYMTTKTGISAYERADTIKAIAEDHVQIEDFRTPGHIFPVIGRDTGLMDGGIVEAVIDVVKMSSSTPVAYMCEILNDVGEISRRDEIYQLSTDNSIPALLLSQFLGFKKNEGLCSEALMQCIQDEIYHFADYSFFKWCEKHFRINRGVFNTIDSIFYNTGSTNIIQRRRAIVSFLSFLSSKSGNKKPVFGHGGLVAKMNEYREYALNNK